MSAEAPRAPRRFRDRLGTVRVRTTLAAALVVGVALLLAAITMVLVLRISLERDVRTAARLRAEDVATLLETGTSPSELVLGDGDESFVQVIDAGGRVVASSAKVRELTRAVTHPRAGESLRLDHLPGDDDPFMIVTRIVERPEGDLTLIVGRSLDVVEESGVVIGRLLLFGIPLLVLVVAATTWGVVGRALRFVESIRAQVAEISSSELHRRVPDPPGHDEIARLAETMNAMLARLEEEQMRQRRFVSDASHELRSPVATIRQQAEVALAHPDRTELQELATEILAEDLRLEKLVEDLLTLARTDEHRAPLVLRPANLDDLVLEEAKRLRDSTPLRVDTAEVSGGRTVGDIAQLRRVVRNLADNAARHAVSAVTFGLHEEDGWVVLRVDDDGPGVAVEHRDTIFQRFTRLDHARDRDHGGAGLGLAIVYESIRAHGGTITVGDAPIGGARFEVRLPVG